ncbi:MAG TPA: AraC family transcriptional regulator [Verrucomicrobiae bacterium]|jgi:AraC-like DNA-binding protein
MKNNSVVELKFAGTDSLGSRADGFVSEIADRIRRSIVYMVAHLDQPIQISALAAQANVSPSHYFALFKQQIGRPPIDYFIRLRMDHARELLNSTSSSVKEIAAIVGYHDQFYFSRVFKSVHRVAPTEYRRRNGKPKMVEPSNSRAIKPLSIFETAPVTGGGQASTFNHLGHNNGRGHYNGQSMASMQPQTQLQK